MRTTTLVSRLKHGADGVNGNVETFRDLTIGPLQRARAHQRSIEFIGKPRTISAKRLNPCAQIVVNPISFPPPLNRAFQRIECRRQPPCGEFDLARAAWRRLGTGKTVGGAVDHHGTAAFVVWPGTQNWRTGKQLGGQIYG